MSAGLGVVVADGDPATVVDCVEDCVSTGVSQAVPTKPAGHRHASLPVALLRKQVEPFLHGLNARHGSSLSVEDLVSTVTGSVVVAANWQRFPEKNSGHMHSISLVISLRKQVAPFLQGL